MNNFSTFGSFIRNKRLQNNLKLKELSEKTDIVVSDLSKLENNKRLRLNKITLEKLCEALHLEEHEYHIFFINYDSNDEYLIFKTPEKNFFTHHKLIEELEDSILSILTPKLIKTGWCVSSLHRNLFDILATNDQENWYIIFNTFENSLNDRKLPPIRFRCKRFASDIFGKVSTFADKPAISKFSIVVINESMFEELKKLNPLNLNPKVSYIYINLETYEYEEFKPEVK